MSSNPSIACSRLSSVSGFVDDNGSSSELHHRELELLGLAAKKYSLKNPLQSSNSKQRGTDLSSPSRRSPGSSSESDDDSIPNCFDVFGKRFGDPKRKGKSKFCGTCYKSRPVVLLVMLCIAHTYNAFIR